MADIVKLVGERRENLGSRASRRLRAEGRIPGSLYGLGKESLSFSVGRDVLTPLIFQGVQVIDVEIDGNTETTQVREVQWDTFGRDVYHFDVQRIDPTKRIAVELSIELRGTSPGVLAGGVLEMAHRMVNVECLAHQIPEHLYLRIHSLQIGDAMHISDLEFPEGVVATDDPETLVLRLNAPVEEEELEEVEGALEPELLGRRADDEGDD